MAEGYRRAHGNHVPGHQAEFHAGLPLGNPITHGRGAASKLGDRPHSVSRLPDHVGEPGIGLVGRQHIVVSGHDGHIGLVHQPEGLLVSGLAGSEAMGQITAREPSPVR